jgi:hypothetical protein
MRGSALDIMVRANTKENPEAGSLEIPSNKNVGGLSGKKGKRNGRNGEMFGRVANRNGIKVTDEGLQRDFLILV